jgi:phosphatidyl-myo-inositol alpha-mannosyltransferase
MHRPMWWRSARAANLGAMRIALVSPYSWTYPGGVTRHIEALAERFIEVGHDVSVLSPFDPDDRLAARLHRGARPAPRPAPDYLVPLGRTFGLPMNGAVSNLAPTPESIIRLRRELEQGYDVVHVHEPIAPTVGWDAVGSTRAPLVGTFHCYSENVVTNTIANAIGARRVLNHLKARIAVSEAAAWTGRRFWGGRYHVIPNGVEVPATLAPKRPSAQLRIVFVGQAVERKGLPVLLRAFEALREHVPASLTIVGADEAEIEPLLLDPRGVTVLGKVDDAAKHRALEGADLLCAPSLGGESFGMVLTEAFAAGTPVVASDIAGYRDVVRDGVDGVLVPKGDPTELAEVLRDLWLEPERRSRLAAEAAGSARHYAWPHVAEQVEQVYEEAIAVGEPPGRARRAAVRLGVVPADLKPREPARRLPSLEPKPAGHPTAVALARRAGLAVAAVLAVLLGWHALGQIGIESIVRTLLHSSPVWVLAGLAVMCVSMMVRGLAWHAILRAALPDVRIRRSDALQGTFIGVLMSATLPARLGEPSRAVVVARRVGRAREHLPTVLGTLVSQTLLNILALVVLGSVMFATVGLFQGRERALVLYGAAPVALLVLVVLAPALLRRAGPFSEWSSRAREALRRVRFGLRVFRDPKLGAQATVLQLGAWALQWLSCYLLLAALGLDGLAGPGAAAAVLFAVNVTAVVPATPSNVGVFQAACVAVLAGGYGVHSVDALGYGIILQAVEVATAVIMGAPALVREGLSWRDVRSRALLGSPVVLEDRPRSRSRRRASEGLEAEG